jgi:hypothetical protein
VDEERLTHRWRQPDPADDWEALRGWGRIDRPAPCPERAAPTPEPKEPDHA